MSRCFPFPPPGYEIKASPDNVNLISKEKHKPKKHKEKKDKEKKERSEKKEKKDRSESKHKDDRKQKKKDKQEKKTEKCVPDDSKSTDGMQDYRILVELGKRVRNDDGATDNRTVGRITVVEQSHELMANGHTPEVEANGSRNGFHGKFCGDRIEKRNELREKKENGNSVGKGKNEDRDKKREEKKRRKKRKKEKKMEKEKKQTKVKESSKENVKRTENNGNALYNNNNNPSDHLKESVDGRGNIPKQEKCAMNGFLHDNGCRPNTTLRAVVEKGPPVTNQTISVIANQKIDVITNHVEKGAVVTNQKIDGVITNGKINGKLSSSQLVVENSHSTYHNGKAGSNNHATSNGNISSQQHSTNPTNVKPNSEPVVENGRKLDNGALDGKTSTSSRPLSVSVNARKEKKVTKPNHHPDLKYLSQILTVPKVDSPRFDDQDWLFGYKAKRPKLGSESTHKHVWAEAIELGAADIIALPYVIPY